MINDFGGKDRLSNDTGVMDSENVEHDEPRNEQGQIL